MKKLKFRRRNRNVLSVSISSKKSRERLLRLSVWAVVGCVIIGCGGAMAWKGFVRYALCQNSDFALRNVEVHVNGAISTAQVLRWSGVEKGQNLIALDLDCVRARLLRIPYIDHVSVERRLPDTLRIIVDERQPIALLQPKSRDGYLLTQ
ncbi:MAG: FtsQ-type POTRA domain-containing protein, partial [bacterium]